MRVPVVLLAVALAGCGGQAADDDRRADDGFVRVARVVDGDTIRVVVGGGEEVVRLIGVDTPETVHPTEPVGCYGPEASAFVSSLLAGGRVRLAFDRARHDRFGRTLAYVYLDDGTFVNRRLVEQGYATVLSIEPNTRFEDVLRSAEAEARSAGRGLWGACAAPSR